MGSYPVITFKLEPHDDMPNIVCGHSFARVLIGVIFGAQIGAAVGVMRRERYRRRTERDNGSLRWSQCRH